jgi:hypothetical protein
MRRTSLTAIGSMFTFALCLASPVMYAERRGDAQQGQQVQQGQRQAQGQSQQGQGQQGQGQQGQGQQGQGQQGQQGAPKPTLPSLSLRKFVFTLALGDVQAGTASTFTPAASKALADLKDFLPYKRYTLLDTIYKIGLGFPGVPMKGPDDTQKYELVTNGAASAAPNRMKVWVTLRNNSNPERPTFLIDTSFEMELGETVVVGTSRLDGNRALLLLVTSVP